MTIDKETVQKISRLAKLKVSEEEMIELSAQLSKALDHFNQIESIDTNGVEPLVTPTEIEQILREDTLEQELTAEQILSNAPQKLGHLFTVPPVV